MVKNIYNSNKSAKIDLSFNSDEDIKLTDGVNAQQLKKQLETEPIKDGEYLLVRCLVKKDSDIMWPRF